MPSHELHCTAGLDRRTTQGLAHGSQVSGHGVQFAGAQEVQPVAGTATICGALTMGANPAG